MRFIFDLDGTIVNSSHRQLTLPNGDLDLSHWRENCTREKILADTLLPLADQWQTALDRGAEIVICTARVMGLADYEFLANHGLYWDACLSRPIDCDWPDAILKESLLREYADDCGITWRRFCMFSIMLDDNKSVIRHLTNRGLRVYNAQIINEEALAA